MKNRSWLILSVGFGSLLLLIGLLEMGTARRADQIYAEISSLHESFGYSERILNEIRSELYLSGILVRDFLLDQSPSAAAAQRQEWLKLRSVMGAQLDRLEGQKAPEQAALLKGLREELNAYWDAREPIFDWTASQRLAFSSRFLRREVLPDRSSVLVIAEEIRAFNEANLKREQERNYASQQGFRRYLRTMSAIALSLGALVAAASILRILRLERRAERQRKETERAAQELRRLSQQLARAQEEERKSISRELHDEIGQMLTALRVELANLEQLRTADEKEFKQHFEEARRLISQSVHFVRDLAMGLRPAMLDDFGLAPALEWHAREFSRRGGIPVDVQIDGDLAELSDVHRTCVYRVVQEALTNCSRHADAKSIRVNVHRNRQTLSLTVQDDGEGFAPNSSSTGLGLIGIEERVRELGGRVAIFSQPGKGTLLQVEIPLLREVGL